MRIELPTVYMNLGKLEIALEGKKKSSRRLRLTGVSGLSLLRICHWPRGKGGGGKLRRRISFLAALCLDLLWERHSGSFQAW